MNVPADDLVCGQVPDSDSVLIETISDLLGLIRECVVLDIERDDDVDLLGIQALWKMVEAARNRRLVLPDATANEVLDLFVWLSDIDYYDGYIKPDDFLGVLDYVCSTNTSFVERGAQHSDCRIRSLAAAHSSDLETLERLTSDESLAVRKAVYQNECCPVEWLENLEDMSVALGAIRHPNCPAILLERLVEHGDKTSTFGLMREVFAHPNLPDHIFERIQQNDLSSWPIFVLRSMLRNQSCPLGLWEKAADSGIGNLMMAAAASLRAPASGLIRLAEHSMGDSETDARIALVLANNPNSPVEVIRLLATRHPDHEVRATAAQHPVCPPDAAVLAILRTSGPA